MFRDLREIPCPFPSKPIPFGSTGTSTSQIVPQECIADRIREHVVDVSVPQVVEQLFVVPKISSQTQPCSAPRRRFLAVPVPRMIEQFVDVPKTVSQDRIQQRTLEQISDNPSSAGSGGSRRSWLTSPSMGFNIVLWS